MSAERFAPAETGAIGRGAGSIGPPAIRIASAKGDVAGGRVVSDGFAPDCAVAVRAVATGAGVIAAVLTGGATGRTAAVSTGLDPAVTTGRAAVVSGAGAAGGIPAQSATHSAISTGPSADASSPPRATGRR